MISSDKIPDTFCTIPWSSIEINNLGYFRVCCVSNSVNDNQGIGKDSNGRWMHVLEHDILDSLNSDLHQSIRNAQLQGKDHSNCKTCQLRDRVSNEEKMSRGRRLFHSVELNRLTGNKFPMWENVTADPELWRKGPVSLDLKLGNLCNLTCAHCDPINSSQWVDLWAEFYSSFENGASQKIGNLPRINFAKKQNGKFEIAETNWVQDQRWHEQFKKISKQLAHIYVTGGEPMLVPWHGEMLDYLISENLSQNIVLEYDSNFTAINNNIVEKFKNFKSVVVRVSLDGIEDVYEWIRWPGKWEKVKQNILENKSIVKEVTGCIMPYNAWNLVEFEKWVLLNNLRSTWRFIITPSHLNLRVFPKKMKEELIELYRSLPTPECKKAANYLEQSFGEEDDAQVLNFIKWADFLSTNRKKDWRQLFPDLARNLKDYT
jgi:hypothetical protein